MPAAEGALLLFLACAACLARYPNIVLITTRAAGSVTTERCSRDEVHHGRRGADHAIW